MLTVICALFQHVCIMRGISKPTSNSSWVITAVAALFAERVWHLCRICLFWLEAILKLLLVYALTNILFATVCSLELQCIYISAWLANRKAISSTGCVHSKSSGVEFHRGASSAPSIPHQSIPVWKSRPMSPRHFFRPSSACRTAERSDWLVKDFIKARGDIPSPSFICFPPAFPPSVCLSVFHILFPFWFLPLRISDHVYVKNTHHSSGWILVSVYRWLTWSRWVLCSSLNADEIQFWDWATWTLSVYSEIRKRETTLKK